MTRNQRIALSILRQHGPEGVVTSGATGVIDSQPWVNWRTAEALQRKGLVVLDGWGEERTLRLAPSSTRPDPSTEPEGGKKC